MPINHQDFSSFLRLQVWMKVASVFANNPYTVGVQGIYTFFGNTIDPMRGKPTNAQILAMLAERVRISS